MDKRKQKNPLKRFFKIALAIGVIALSAQWTIRHFVKPDLHEALRRQSGTAVSPKPAARDAARKKKAPAVTPAANARMAIILDDWGNNLSVLEQALALERPLTLSILPNLPHSERIAERASQAGLGVMLHLPMQPLSKSQPLEPQTIMTTTPDPLIRRYLNDALASVPHAEGVNNHQGSAATRDARVMETVLSEIKARKLFFIDSAVTGDIKSPAIARRLGLPYARRDVFIDNVNKVDLVKTQLREAVRVARKTGRVFVIGHDRKTTLEAIRQMLPEIEGQGVRLVTAKELIAA